LSKKERENGEEKLNKNGEKIKNEMGCEKLRVGWMRKPRRIGAEINLQSFLGGIENSQAIGTRRQMMRDLLLHHW
jgi:hypothetical protein